MQRQKDSHHFKTLIKMEVFKNILIQILGFEVLVKPLAGKKGACFNLLYIFSAECTTYPFTTKDGKELCYIGKTS